MSFAAAVLATYAAVGLGAGWVWHELWQPGSGVVVSHEWYPQGDGLTRDFGGTGIYVLVAAACGVVLGLVFALRGGDEPLMTVAWCVVGSAVAAWAMLRLGESLGPPDPHRLAADAADGTVLPSALRVTGASPLLAFPMGSLAALAAVFTLLAGKSREARYAAEPRG